MTEDSRDLVSRNLAIFDTIVAEAKGLYRVVEERTKSSYLRRSPGLALVDSALLDAKNVWAAAEEAAARDALEDLISAARMLADAADGPGKIRNARTEADKRLVIVLDGIRAESSSASGQDDGAKTGRDLR